MSLDRAKFYHSVRNSLFGGELEQSEVDGMEAILDEWEKRGFTDLRWLAYELGTIYHETASEMQPTKERGGEKYLKSKPYYPYYGRDMVQTTWRANYEKVKKFTGVDVVSNPALIADLKVSAATALEFMYKGYYTGVGFKRYFNAQKEDWRNARKIINGLDRADTVAEIAKKFYAALT